MTPHSDNPDLGPERFGEFYEELYPNRKPYRWHERVARELADGTAWKDGEIWSVLTAPTGTGKTTFIECFLFALACAQARATFPRRLFWVVDRRSVVDQVYEHARRVTALISSAQNDGLVAAVRDQLEQITGGTVIGGPVQVRLWRGGLDSEPTGSTPKLSNGSSDATRFASTAELRLPLSPIAPAVVCSTVDQVGSRLLFRGYGVSRRSRPIEAALVGTDSLIVLDEAHLSVAFEKTTKAIADIQRSTPEHQRRVQVMSATATRTRTESSAHIFHLTPAELDDPAIAIRRRAKRPATLMPASNATHACIAAARELADERSSGVIGVVANTVSSARRIADALSMHGAMLLIIGPARGLDREDLLCCIPARDKRDKLTEPLFVVGTQTLEVGLDVDFDALVTECAPLSSLIQRFGRLDRAGQLTERGTPARGVIVQPPKQCVVYGPATAATWEFLRRHTDKGPLEFSIEQTMDLLAQTAADQCEVGQPRPPLLRPWHIELFAQTSHRPVPDPDVAVFLRGERALEPADIQICWRSDLTGDATDDHTLTAWKSRVEARLPHPGEMLPLPLRAAQRWLAQEAGADQVADVEGLARPEEALLRQHDGLPVIRVLPPDADGNVETELVSADQLRPGNVVVMPAHVGGCDEFGWNPSSKKQVSDLGNLSRSRLRVLLSASVGTPDQLLKKVSETLQLMAEEEIDEEEAYKRLVDDTRSWLASMGGTGEPRTPPQAAAQWLALNLHHKGRVIRLSGDDHGATDVVLASHRQSVAGRQDIVLYDDHAAAVEQRIATFAAHLQLDELTPTLRAAARHHDVGKLDRRFQAWLNGGSAADPALPLAKSEREAGTPISWRARLDARWPRYKRHEALSAALLSNVESWPADVDRDLLLYLVSVHHGDARPFRWFTHDPDPVRVTAQIDGQEVEVYSDEEISWSEHAHRFAALSQRLGTWGLAAVESLLVLADRAVSAEGS